jgi:hypothetical protein
MTSRTPQHHTCPRILTTNNLEHLVYRFKNLDQSAGRIFLLKPLKSISRKIFQVCTIWS